MDPVKLLFAAAAAGHLLCGWCDCIITYTPNGRLSLEALKDNEKMSELFEGMPLVRPMRSMLFGCLALFMCAFGYYGLCEWIKPYSTVGSYLMPAALAMFIVSGTAHHVFCGLIEWFYIRLDRTEQARGAVIEFFKKTSVTMIFCYIGQAVFCAAFFAAVVTGRTPLPVWASVINLIPFYLVLAPFRVPGAGNWAGAAMFIGLMFLI